MVERVFHRKRPVKSLNEPLRLLHFYLDGFIFGLATIPIDLLNMISASNGPSIILGLFPILLYFSYYIGLEYYFQATIAKLITGSIVVNEYGERPDFKSICYRTLSRIVPLEPFSFFWSENKRFWHDSWSNTYVVSKEELALINKIRSGEKLEKLDRDDWHNWQ